MTTIEITYEGSEGFLDDICDFIFKNRLDKWVQAEEGKVYCVSLGSGWTKNVADRVLEYMKGNDKCNYINAQICIEGEGYFYFDKGEN